MKKIFFFTIIVLIFSSFKKGEPVAILKCKSASGRTIFEATVPSGSYIEKARFSIDGSSISFDFKDRSAIIFDPEDHVFTMYLETKSESPAGGNFVKFWAIPKTFKQTVDETGPGSEFHDVYEFRAMIFGTEPSYEPGKIIFDTTINLTQKQVDTTNLKLDNAGFWTLQTESRDTNGLDGSEWIIEVYKNGNYHMVVRWTPEKGTNFRAIGEYLFSISQVRNEMTGRDQGDY